MNPNGDKPRLSLNGDNTILIAYFVKLDVSH